jgi:hypothetical protein
MIQDPKAAPLSDDSPRAGSVIHGQLGQILRRIAEIQAAVDRHAPTVPQGGLFLSQYRIHGQAPFRFSHFP